MLLLLLACLLLLLLLLLLLAAAAACCCCCLLLLLLLLAAAAAAAAAPAAGETWSTHKKIIPTTAQRGLRRSVPDNFPYFHVQWESPMCSPGNGYAHVIEDEVCWCLPLFAHYHHRRPLQPPPLPPAHNNNNNGARAPIVANARLTGFAKS